MNKYEIAAKKHIGEGCKLETNFVVEAENVKDAKEIMGEKGWTPTEVRLHNWQQLGLPLHNSILKSSNV